jgi:hypothetical protein
MMQAAGDPNATAEQLRCESCGGVLLYEPAVSALKCKHCKAVGGPHLLAPRTSGARELSLQAGLTNLPRGFGTVAQAVQCNECGATVTLSPEERSGACLYCASPMVVTVAAGQTTITPESLIPFQVWKDRATEAFRGWLGGLWFRPNDLSKMAKLEQIAGVYVPYWTFDAEVRSDWTAERGYHYTETETYQTTENGQSVTRTRQVTKTRWEHASGWRQDHFDDVLVCGSKGVPEPLVDKLATFDTKRLLPYSPGYLAGFRAEAYVVDLPQAWQKAQKKIDDEQERRCGSDVGGDTHRSLSVRTQTSRETFKHVLLPLYVAAYRYNDKPFQVLVNGQTAEVVGRAPYSFWKIALAVLAVLAVLALIFVLTRESKKAPPTTTTTTTTTQPVKAPPVKTVPKK